MSGASPIIRSDSIRCGSFRVAELLARRSREIRTIGPRIWSEATFQIRTIGPRIWSEVTIQIRTIGPRVVLETEQCNRSGRGT